MVNQLLAGVHIAAAAEAMAFGARLSIQARVLYEIIQHARGYSWSVSLCAFFFFFFQLYVILGK